MKDGTATPTHKRLLSKQSTMFDDPTKATTTTRALLVSVVAPCKFSTINNSSIIGDTLDDAEKNVDSSAESIGKKKEDKNAPVKVYDAPIKTNENGIKVHPLLASQAVSASTKESNTSSLSSNPGGNNEANETEELEDAQNDVIPMREELTGVESQEITAEEAAAVTTVGKDPRSSEIEIQIEELLRITFQALLDEYHLLNLPTFSRVDDKKIFKNASMDVEIKEESTPFVRMEVMARPSSLGIILERLERIGVGTNVGTVSIYKAELCRTASPYLTLPVKEEVLEDVAPGVTPIVAERGPEISDRVETAEDEANSEENEKMKE